MKNLYLQRLVVCFVSVFLSDLQYLIGILKLFWEWDLEISDRRIVKLVILLHEAETSSMLVVY